MTDARLRCPLRDLLAGARGRCMGTAPFAWPEAMSQCPLSGAGAKSSAGHRASAMRQPPLDSVTVSGCKVALCRPSRSYGLGVPLTCGHQRQVQLSTAAEALLIFSDHSTACARAEGVWQPTIAGAS